MLPEADITAGQHLFLVGYATADQQESVISLLTDQGALVLHYVPDHHLLVSATLEAVLLAEQQLGTTAVRHLFGGVVERWGQ